MIQRRWIRRITTVGIRDSLGRINVAKPRERGQTCRGLIASVRDEAERIAWSLGSRKHRAKAWITFSNTTTPDHASTCIVVTRGGVDSVYHQELALVLGEEVKRLHAARAVVYRRGRSLKGTDGSNLAHLEHLVDVHRPIASFRIAEVGRIPTSTCVNHDE